MTHQRTIKEVTRATGVGVHSGKRVEMTLRPAAANTGIIFRRIDLDPVVDIIASAQTVGDTRLASTLVNGNVKVSTVEHLLSACAGLGIDNLYVDLTAEEVPIMDGSAATFVFLLQNAGIEQQTAPRRYLEVLKTIEIQEGEGAAAKWARLEPHFGFKLKVSIEFNHPGIDSTGTEVSFDLAQNSYASEVARARTFGFAKDVEMLRAAGLARGGTMDNVIVVDDYRVLNADGLRYADEFARHKLLDAVGDLYVIGMPLLASFTAHKTGHALNNRLLRTLLDQPEAYRIVTFDAPGQVAPKLLLTPDLAIA